jgi:hypothetical protein
VMSLECLTEKWQTGREAKLAGSDEHGLLLARLLSRPQILSDCRLRHLDQPSGSRHDRVGQLESVGSTPLAPTINDRLRRSRWQLLRNCIRGKPPAGRSESPRSADQCPVSSLRALS